MPILGIWGLIVPLLAALVPTGSTRGRSVFCTLWQNEVVTESHEKAGLGIKVLRFWVSQCYISHPSSLSFICTGVLHLPKADN